jgi:hypothetical protein
LRCEIDELRDLVRRMEENVDDAVSTLERWRETFDMVGVDGGWSWGPFWDKYRQTLDDYNALVRD